MSAFICTPEHIAAIAMANGNNTIKPAEPQDTEEHIAEFLKDKGED